MPTPPSRPIPPPVYFGIALLAMLLLDYALPIALLIRFPMSLFGLVPVVAGIGLNLLAARAFKAQGTTVKPFQRSTHLVTGGVFGLSRNPMYLGMLLVLVGVAVVSGTLAPFVVIPFFAVLLDVRFVRAEERMLAETFGAQWQDYRNRVRRWV